MTVTHADECAQNAALLQSVFTGGNAWCQEKICPVDRLSEGMPLLDFLSGDGLGITLERYHNSFGRCDARAAASFWSLYYFSTLTIPFVIAARQNIRLPITPETMYLRVDACGLPMAFGIAAPVEKTLNQQKPIEWINHLIAGHLEIVVKRLKDVAGLSHKLSWNNAAVYIEYALKQAVENSSGVGSDVTTDMVFTSPVLPDGSANPFVGCLRYEADHDVTYCRRKICCLRYMLPGIDGCGELCAKPELRKLCTNA